MSPTLVNNRGQYLPGTAKINIHREVSFLWYLVLNYKTTKRDRFCRPPIKHANKLYLYFMLTIINIGFIVLVCLTWTLFEVVVVVILYENGNSYYKILFSYEKDREETGFWTDVLPYGK